MATYYGKLTSVALIGVATGREIPLKVQEFKTEFAAPVDGRYALSYALPVLSFEMPVSFFNRLAFEAVLNLHTRRAMRWRKLRRVRANARGGEDSHV